MEDLRRLEAKGLARAKARSKRRRISTIRRRTVRGALALFAIFWAIVFGQLATGNDPTLSGGSEKAAAAGEGRGSGHRAPEAAAPATASPEPEVESGVSAERRLEAELEAEREPEWAAEPEWAPEPVTPIITSAS